MLPPRQPSPALPVSPSFTFLATASPSFHSSIRPTPSVNLPVVITEEPKPVEPPSLSSPRLSAASQSLLKHQKNDLEARRRCKSEMLLIHQTGSVKIGEVVRYTIKYSPAKERVLPLPTTLHLRIKNTESIPFRAAYLHGPYVLYVSVKSSTFNAWEPVLNPREEGGYPEFEPNLKAGGSWECVLPVPAGISHRVMEREREKRLSGGSMKHVGDRKEKEEEEESITWIVEVVSQMIFSSTAKIGYDIMLARDEKSLHHFGHGLGEEGTFSKAIIVKIQTTDELWNLPPFPGDSEKENKDTDEGRQKPKKKNKGPSKVHLVMISHGLHSNTGADMLYLKESIDKVTERLRNESRAKRKERQDAPENQSSHKPLKGDSEEDDEEQIITRGFHGNVCRTERGIKYLGKRLARYILSLVNPDQPFPRSLREKHKAISSPEQPSDSDPHKIPTSNEAYTVTSISFIGHSLGGLVQTYAIAYIHAHAPQFFHDVTPVNFISLASPFLGLSNENPMYVKFALDFGLVGRTGQDLGLTWKAPSAAAKTVASAFTSTPSHLSATGESLDSMAAGSKPLLRILPTGPAREVLKMFRNRTVYANVVNDGIVPLRTSCLLFLDWKGLDRVEKARRQNEGPVGQVSGLVGWGWGQLTSAGSGAGTPRRNWTADEEELEETASGAMVGEAPNTTVQLAARHSTSSYGGSDDESNARNTPNPFSSFLTLFKPHAGSSKKAKKIYSRSQTVQSSAATKKKKDSLPQLFDNDIVESPSVMTPSNNDELPELNPTTTARGQASAPAETDDVEKMFTPPRTTLLEAAGDVLNPPLPSLQYIINPASRARTIYHDRVYHPDDIPPISEPRPGLLSRTNSLSLANRSASTDSIPPSPALTTPTSPSTPSHKTTSTSHLKAEEKIARAYHDGISWRKVLVRLEPDAHNNMIVRREFSNAYGWPVVKHLVDTHFEDTPAANTRDDEEDSNERALGVHHGSWAGGKSEVKEARTKAEITSSAPVPKLGQPHPHPPPKLFTPQMSLDDRQDSMDSVDSVESQLTIKPGNSNTSLHLPPSPGARYPGSSNEDSGIWSDGAFSTDDEDEDEEDKKEAQAKDDERRRMERIDSFLGKGKGKVVAPLPAKEVVVGGSATKVGISSELIEKLGRVSTREEDKAVG